MITPMQERKSDEGGAYRIVLILILLQEAWP
jgi:hypothetical protein